MLNVVDDVNMLEVDVVVVIEVVDVVVVDSQDDVDFFEFCLNSEQGTYKSQRFFHGMTSIIFISV